MKRLLLLLLLFIHCSPLMAAGDEILIGVLSHRGKGATITMWKPTADYLSAVIPDRQFRIVPLDFDEVEPAVQEQRVDFLLVNPGIYVNMEVRHRVSRIATLNNLVGELAYNTFGGVVFTAAGRDDINSLADLRRHSLMAVDETSLGGFQMAWREMHAVGLDPYKHVSELRFAGTHDEVVKAVASGKVDVGTVRTDILERMAVTGEIELEWFKIISPKYDPDFIFKRSTRLYPEWPFSKLHHTDNALAQQVAVALLNMPKDHLATMFGNYEGWTVPLDYQPVHELFRELELPPYRTIKQFTLADAVRKYWYWLLAGVLFLFSMVFMTTWVVRLNRELKKAKKSLEQRHELILNSVADGIYGVDLHGNSTFVNRAMEQITGWRAEEIIGKNQHDILHHTHADGTPHPREACPVYATYKDSEPRYVSDDIFWKKDGTSFPVEYAATPIRDDRGFTVGSVVIFRDISERKRAEEATRQHQLDLAHVARLSTMGEMASGIAHEINQPLTAIATNAHACIRMLEAGVTQQRLADILDRIGSQAQRAGEIIRQLRQFVRKEQPELSSVNINDLIAEVVVLLQTELRKARVQLVLELEEALPSVWVQNIQIEQVILNLARNAIEAMAEANSPQRQLVIRSACIDERYVTVSVVDTGPGLKPEVRDAVFNPFVTTKPKGMGLGLSISQGIIEAHNGQLQVDSETGFGAEFRFTVPIDNRGHSV